MQNFYEFGTCLPEWNSSGFIPPIHPSVNGFDLNRSPYSVRISDFVEEYATSNIRIDILNGLLDYRKALRDANIAQGFQWIDGSFSENIELIEGRSPRDIDVLTYIRLSEGDTDDKLFSRAPIIFDKKQVKKLWKVDGYLHPLGDEVDYNSIKMISYWYSMWSHRRNNDWKGFVQISLDYSYDEEARNIICRKQGDQYEK